MSTDKLSFITNSYLIITNINVFLKQIFIALPNTNSIIRVLRDAQLPVSQYWNQIGCDLGVPIEERRKLRHTTIISSDYWTALEECIEWWIRNDSQPTLTNLLATINNADRAAANAMRAEFLNANDLSQTTPRNNTNTIHFSIIDSPINNQPTDRPKLYKSSVLKIVAVITLLVSILVMYPDPLAIVVIVVITMATLVFYYRHMHKNNKIVSCQEERDLPEIINDADDKDPHNESRIWTAGETGTYVVETCLEKIKMLAEMEVFPNDKNMMKRIAFIMSRNGDASFRLLNDGGIWQVSRYAFDDTKDELGHVRLPKKYQKLRDILGIEDWRNVKITDLEKPLYSALAARLYLSNFAEAIPPSFDIEKQQKYWWRHYMLQHEAKQSMNENDFRNGVAMMRE